jgi:hypothetical protein
MPFIRAETDHPFTSNVRGAADGAQAKFEIYSHGHRDGAQQQSVAPEKLTEGQVPVAGGTVTYTWHTQGPPTDGENGQRAWRVSFKVKVPREGRDPLEAASREADVYHPWVELETVKEDGSALPNVTFDLRVVNGTRTALRRRGLRTDGTGKLRVSDLPPGDVGIDFPPPFRLVEWVSGTGCKLKAKVKVVKQARFVTPAVRGARGDHKQYVNLPADPSKPELGRTLKVKVQLQDGKAGDKLYAKLEYEANAQSPRNVPASRPLLTGGQTTTWAPNGGKELTLASDGEQPVLEIDVGLAGGDTFALHIGGDDRCGDQTLEVTNWRKLFYEVMAPAFMSLSNATLDDGRAGKDFPAGLKRRVQRRAATAFIEYVGFKSHVFPKTDCRDGLTDANGTLFTRAYLGKGGSGDAFMLTDHTFEHFYPRRFDTGRSPRSVHMKLCDANWFRDTTVTTRFDATAARTVFDLTTHDGDGDGNAELAANGFFPRSCEDGTYAVKSLRWKAVTTGAAGGHPGFSSGTTPKQGTVAAADIPTWIEPITYQSFAVKFPAGSDPANLAGALDATHCPIKVAIEFETASEGLGMAADHAGVTVNLIVYDTSSTDPVADVILHELGHHLGQTTAATGGNSEAPGAPARDGVDTVGSDGHRGDVYVDHEHSGPHCAYGLSDADKGRAGYMSQIGGRAGTCIMFGHNSYGGASLATAGFCPGCLVSMKARDLTSIPAETT